MYGYKKNYNRSLGYNIYKQYHEQYLDMIIDTSMHA